MEQVETIVDSQGEKYMSKFLADLPDNVMLNKVLTGCGGTTVALSNNVPYVICVPFRAMIKNKMQWAAEEGKNICPVMGGISDKEIADYKGNKYIVTYDSLHRLNKFINPKEFKILIDESHKLIDSASFRNDAVDVVLENYKKYGSFVFMTATPVRNVYQLPELKHIPKVKIKWYDIEEVKVSKIVPKRPLPEEIAIIAARHLTGAIPSNAHIFINSVLSIIEIIQIIDKRIASPDNIHIICADTEKNLKKLKETIGKKWMIKNVGDVAKVNFYTSTAFEGSDIYDENGKTYVVTDGMKDYTKNDILTTLPQIIGRIRNTKFKNDIDLIYSTSPYFGNGITEVEYYAVVQNELTKAKKYVDLYNSIDPTDLKNARVNLYEGAEDDKFLKQHADSVLKVNQSAACNEMHSFAALNTTYYAFGNRVIGESRTADVNSVPYTYTNGTPSTFSMNDLILVNIRRNYPETLKYFIDNMDDEELTASIRVVYPEMLDYVKVLGVEKIVALRYRKKPVRDAFTKSSTVMSNPIKIVRMLNLHVNQFVTAAEIKTKLTNIFKELGITKPATASDICQWYEVRPKVKRNRKSGTLERGYEIAMCKFKKPSDDEIRLKTAAADLVDTFTINTDSLMIKN